MVSGPLMITNGRKECELCLKEKTVKENSSAAFLIFLPFGYQMDIKKGLPQGKNLVNKPFLW